MESGNEMQELTVYRYFSKFLLMPFQSRNTFCSFQLQGSSNVPNPKPQQELHTMTAMCKPLKHKTPNLSNHWNPPDEQWRTEHLTGCITASRAKQSYNCTTEQVFKGSKALTLPALGIQEEKYFFWWPLNICSPTDQNYLLTPDSSGGTALPKSLWSLPLSGHLANL